MDNFTIYLNRNDGSRMRVIARAVDASGYHYDVEINTGEGWRPFSPASLDAIVGAEARFRVVASLVTSALALGIPPRLVAMEGLPEMPVWVVMESSAPAIVLARLHDRTRRAEGVA